MFVQIEAQTIINEWVRIVPAQLKFLGPTTLIQFNVKNWTMLEIGDGVGVEVSWQKHLKDFVENDDKTKVL